MASIMRTARAGLEIIKTFEGFSPRYRKLPNGRWLIGYGHVRQEREGVRVSEFEAETILREYDLPPVEQLVTDCILAPLNQNEFDALVSLAFNVGHEAFASSELVHALNAGHRIDAADAIEGWKFARIAGKLQLIDALVRRRAAEKALFLKAPGYMTVASSCIVKPLQEHRAIATDPEPKEILVERRQLPNGMPAQTAIEQLADPLEEASVSVRREMVRILGEEDGQEQAAMHRAKHASPEEITAAVLDMVEASGPAGRLQKSVWPAREDLPPPPFFSESVQAPDHPPQGAAPGEAVIDDLEQIDIRPSDIHRALRTNREIEFEDQIILFNGVLPYLVAAAAGLLLFILGLSGALGWIGKGQGEAVGLALYLPPMMILVGALLSVLMVTYLVLAMRRPA